MIRRLVLPVLCCLFTGLLCLDAKSLAESSPSHLQGSEQVTVEAELTANGSTLLSIPLDLGSLDVGEWLVPAGVSSKGAHGWDPRSQKYVPLTTVRPGQGFLLARGPGKLPVTGQRVSVAVAVELPLGKGWNLVGVPYEKALPIAKLRIVLEGKAESFLVARERKWVGGVNALVDGRSSALDVDSAQLEPWRGYWLYAYQPCQLIFPALQQEAEAQEKKGARAKKR